MKRGFTLLMMALLLTQALVAWPSVAQAQVPPVPGVTVPGVTAPAATTGTDQQQCTNFAERKQQIFGGTTANADGTASPASPGLLTDIYNYIKNIVTNSTQRLFNAFIGSAAYQAAVYGALTLMVIIFAVGFMIGVIQPSFGQVLIRLIKFGLIITLISPGGWAFFNHYVVTFFNDGTDELVRGVTALGTDVKPPAGASPFYQFDRLAAFLIQPQTFIAIMGATFAGGPYGLGMAGLMLFAIAGFVSLLIKALRVYAVSYVARALLLGIAPVFFVFLLFEKTKQLFTTWVNALISLSLQPILLFTFLSFFMVLIESATRDMLNTELCWTPFRTADGTTNQQAFWRFVDPNTGGPIRADMTWRGTFDCVVSGRDDCPEFPMNVIDILTFLILIYLAQRFANIIERVAYELSNAFIALDAGGRFDQFLGSGGQSAAAPPIQRQAPRTDPLPQTTRRPGA